MGDPNAEPKTQVLSVLKRLEKTDPDRAKEYEGWLDKFESEMAKLVNTELKPVNDWGYLPIPKHCQVIQIIWQIPPKFSGDPRYWVKDELWKKLDKRNQATLMLHEIIYRDALRRGQEDSSGARYLNEIISSTRAETVTLEQYRTWIKDASLDRFRFDFKAGDEIYRCGDPGNMTLSYFTVGEMPHDDADTFCSKRKMEIVREDCMKDIAKYTPFSQSPFYRFIRSEEYLGKNVFWAADYVGTGSGYYTTVQFENELSFSCDKPSAAHEILCLGRF